MRKKLAICIILIVVGALGMAGYYSLKQKSEPPKPQRVTFPFSWIETDHRNASVEITVVNITAFGKTFRSWEAEEGYQFYGVYLTFKNLHHMKYQSHGSEVGAYLEIETNRTNIYKPVSLLPGDPPDLEPEEESGEWVRFEIRIDEKPIELRDYEWINGESYIAYIWEIQ